MPDPIFTPLEKCVGRETVPQCCLECGHYESEYDEHRDVTVRYCNINLRFPIRKLTCKRQSPFIKQKVTP